MVLEVSAGTSACGLMGQDGGPGPDVAILLRPVSAPSPWRYRSSFAGIDTLSRFPLAEEWHLPAAFLPCESLVV